MCTSPIRILNPSKWLAPDQGQQLYLYVPCGHCVECRQQKQNEWRIRSFYECVDTIRRGGYMLFDTLTYSNQFLPRVSDFEDVPHHLDFSCFRADDITNFFKRLRQNLHTAGYDVDGSLRYFVTCEYGKRNTRRPHYHLFLFVRGSVVPPDVLSSHIGKAWSVDGVPIGRTDGLPYRTRAYVCNHNTFRDINDECNKRCICYVAKYVAKDFAYMDMVQRRLHLLLFHKFGDMEWQTKKKYREYYKWLCRFVSPFHRQSLGFGNYYIEAQGIDNIIANGFIKFNFNGLPLTFALFPSLKRKLFYNYTRIDGDVRFYLNNRGILFKQSRFQNMLSSVQNDIENYNLSHDDKLHFDSFDFLFNHNRLSSVPCVSLSDCFRQLVSSASVSFHNGLRNYSCHDRGFIHKSVFTKRDFGSRRHGFVACQRLAVAHDVDQMDESSFITLDEFTRYALYYPEIELQYQAFLLWRRSRGAKAMAVARHKERLKNIYKSLNIC